LRRHSGKESKGGDDDKDGKDVFVVLRHDDEGALSLGARLKPWPAWLIGLLCVFSAKPKGKAGKKGKGTSADRIHLSCVVD
jgi:hypothetical protein